MTTNGAKLYMCLWFYQSFLFELDQVLNWNCNCMTAWKSPMHKLLSGRNQVSTYRCWRPRWALFPNPLPAVILSANTTTRKRIQQQQKTKLKWPFSYSWTKELRCLRTYTLQKHGLNKFTQINFQDWFKWWMTVECKIADLEALEVAKPIVRPVLPQVSVVPRALLVWTHGVPPPKCICHHVTLHIAPTCPQSKVNFKTTSRLNTSIMPQEPTDRHEIAFKVVTQYQESEESRVSNQRSLWPAPCGSHVPAHRSSLSRLWSRLCSKAGSH